MRKNNKLKRCFKLSKNTNKNVYIKYTFKGFISSYLLLLSLIIIGLITSIFTIQRLITTFKENTLYNFKAESIFEDKILEYRYNHENIENGMLKLDSYGKILEEKINEYESRFILIIKDKEIKSLCVKRKQL